MTTCNHVVKFNYSSPILQHADAIQFAHFCVYIKLRTIYPGVCQKSKFYYTPVLIKCICIADLLESLFHRSVLIEVNLS